MANLHNIKRAFALLLTLSLGFFGTLQVFAIRHFLDLPGNGHPPLNWIELTVLPEDCVEYSLVVPRYCIRQGKKELRFSHEEIPKALEDFWKNSMSDKLKHYVVGHTTPCNCYPDTEAGTPTWPKTDKEKSIFLLSFRDAAYYLCRSHATAPLEDEELEGAMYPGSEYSRNNFNALLLWTDVWLYDTAELADELIHGTCLRCDGRAQRSGVLSGPGSERLAILPACFVPKKAPLDWKILQTT